MRQSPVLLILLILPSMSEAAAKPSIWDDRRPIGMVFVCNHANPWQSESNPAGWLNDAELNPQTDSGFMQFRKKLLWFASRSAGVVRAMDGQGVLVWDMEGAPAGAELYVGDPRVAIELSPELGRRTNGKALIDEFFAVYRAAGLRVGVTLRPTRFAITGPRSGSQKRVGDVKAELLAKMDDAKQRWGCSIFYVDSNDANRPLPLEELHACRPDILLIPEHTTVRHYQFSAPLIYFNGLEQHQARRSTVSGSFGAIFPYGNTPEDVARLHGPLVDAVRSGDIMICAGWPGNTINASLAEVIRTARAPEPTSKPASGG